MKAERRHFTPQITLILADENTPELHYNAFISTHNFIEKYVTNTGITTKLASLS
jgi:hypothetical protein